MKYAYICAPYRASCKKELERNIKRVQQFAKEIWGKGIIPIYTHGSYFWLQETIGNRDKILNLCKRLIDICDVVYVLRKDDGKSKALTQVATVGMQIEILYARKKRKKIIFV